MKKVLSGVLFIATFVLGLYIARFVTDIIFWRWIIAIAFCLIVEFAIYYVKAFKDPDVRAASSLGMSVNRYRWYRQHYDEWQDAMTKYGTDSKETYKVFNEFFPKIKNMNEWRRYQEYRLKETQSNMFNRLNEIYNN